MSLTSNASLKEVMNTFEDINNRLVSRSGITDITGVAKWPDNGVALYHPGGYYPSPSPGRSELKVSEQLLNSIGYTLNGRKWASGTANNTSHPTFGCASIDIRNLNFKPSIVIAQLRDGSEYNMVGIIINVGVLTYAFRCYTPINSHYGSSQTIYAYSDTSTILFDNGFNVPVPVSTSSQYTWHAFE